MTTNDRRGFTLAELIVVAVVGSFLLAAILQVLITNQRTYTAQNAQIQGQQALRASLDILSGELREISPSGGDLVGMGTDTVRVRVSRNFGLVCSDTTKGVAVFRVLKVGDWFTTSDSVFVFADNDGSTTDDDTWITTKVSAVDTTASCGSFRGQELTFSPSGAFATDSVSKGAEVRAFTHYTYGLTTYDGDYYLGRHAPNGTDVPLVGPLSSNGVSFTYLDSNGTVTATAANVAQMGVTVRTSSDVMDPTGNPVADSLTVRINLRN